MFSMRFIVQWIASERARRSIGDVLVFQHGGRGDAVRLRDLPARSGVHAGQGIGLLIYARNIYIIRTHRGRGQRPAPGSAGRPRRLNGLDGGGTRVDEAAIRRHLPPVTTF